MTPRSALVALASALVAACGAPSPAPLELPSPDDAEVLEPADAADAGFELPPADGGPVSTCTRRDDCAHLDDCCYEGWCPNGVCQLRYKLDCCSVPGPCASSTTHHTATCEATCQAGGCVPRLDLPDAPCDETVHTLEPSADTLAASLISDSLPNDAVTWHLTSRRGLEGRPSFHAGHVTCPTYFSGPLDAACTPLPGAAAAPVSLGLTTPSIALPTGGPLVAELWVWASFEVEPRGPATHTPYDGLEVRAVLPSGYIETLWSSRTHPLPRAQWTPVLVDLSRWVGQTVSLRLAFDTLDGVDNHHEGLYVGGLRVTRVCAGQRDCAAAQPCQVGVPTPVAGVDDALCVLSAPDPQLVCQPCEKRADCVPADACDAVACVGGRCQVTRTLTPTCCTHDDVWPDPGGFEVPLDEAWTFEPDDSGAAWHLSALRAVDGQMALRFGLPDTPGLAPPGASAQGTLWSPPVTVPSELPALRASVWMETEWSEPGPLTNPAGVDRLEVLVRWEVLDGLAPSVVWSSDLMGGTTAGQWRQVEIPLDGLAGQPVRVGLRFDTGDEHANEGEGVYVDAVTLGRRCPECPEGAPCSEGPREPPDRIAPEGAPDPSRPRE